MVLTVICAPFVSPALRRICLPYVPATTTQVSNVMKAVKGRNGQLIDLGSGDGRIVSSVPYNEIILDSLNAFKNKYYFYLKALIKTVTVKHNVQVFALNM